MPKTQQLDRIDAWVWRVSAVVVLGSIMAILDTTIVNVALQTLHDDLHSPLADIQWVISGYLLALAVVIPISGWASRRFGAKNIYLMSIVLFTAGSALCGLAGSTDELIAFRVLQGIGGGMIMPVGQIILADAAGPKRMGRVLAITGVPTMLGPILGPTIGGFVIDSASWRWIFYVNVPIGIVATVLALRMLPARKRDAQVPPLDVAGLLMLSIGLPLLTYGLAEIGITGGFSSPKVLISIIAGMLLIAAFVWHALRVEKPLLDLRLFRRNTYAAAAGAMFCITAAMYGVMILLPLYFQGVRHESVFHTGLLLAPQGLGMAVVLPIVGRLADRVGGGPLTIAGVIIAALIGIPFGLIGANTSFVWLAVEQVIRGIGISFAFMPAYIAAMAALERHELADAAPQLNMLSRVGGSIGTAVLAVVLQRSITAAGARPSPSALAGAYGTGFWWGAALMAAAIVPCVILLRAERKARRVARARAAAVEGDGESGSHPLAGVAA